MSVMNIRQYLQDHNMKLAISARNTPIFFYMNGYIVWYFQQTPIKKVTQHGFDR